MKLILFVMCALLLIGNVSADVENVADVMHFWNEANIPSLYATVANETRMSYNATEDIYTMHFPFYQNNSGDTFYLNETLHLESNNDGSTSYFRFAGKVEFDNHTILGWNTTSNAPAPLTDNTRACIYSDGGASGNITNGNMSYLGYSPVTDNHKRSGVYLEGFNNSLILNNSFLHNDRGIIIQYSNNNTVNNNTIYGSDGHGLQLYRGDGFHTVNNNTISNNVGCCGSGIFLDRSDNNNLSNNTIHSQGHNGIFLATSDTNNIINNTIYSNGYSGVNLIMSVGNILTNNNVNDTSGAYYDYLINPISTGTIIVDTVKTSNYYSISSMSDPVTFQNGADYVVYVPTTTIIRDNAATGVDSVNITVVSGIIDQLNVSSLTASIPYYLYYINNTIIEIQTSDANGSSNFSSDLTAGTYLIASMHNYYNFTFTNEAISPTTVRENEPVLVSVDISDVDGSISTAIVKISGTNYTMTKGTGNTWNYVFTETSVPTEYYVTDFYAKDVDNAWNSTTSSMVIVVTSSGGTGVSPPPAEPTPEPTEEPTVEPTEEPEEPIITVPDITFPSVSPSNGGYDIKIGDTHVTVPEFFESPLWAIALFMMGSLILVGITVEAGGKK